MNGFEVLEEFPSHAVDVGQVCVRMRNPNIQNEMEEEQNQDQDQGPLNNDLYACPDPYCQKQYVRSANLEKHLAIGNHLYRKAEETGIDYGIKIWVEKCSAIREKYAHICETVLSQSRDTGIVSLCSGGWALKSVAKCNRFSLNVKEYVKKIFESCEKTGKRPNYAALSGELQKACDENGQRLFRPFEWLTANQLRNLFASYINNKKKNYRDRQILLLEVPETDEHLQEIVMNLKAEERQQTVSDMYENVFYAANT
eukprot:XP_011421337.1 PREDICTED: uncharacterized protein LOC105323967 [Crassostrea gigas]